MNPEITIVQDDLTVITLEQGYENSRGKNIFYTLHVFIIIMTYSWAGILPYSIPFLVKMPDLLCRLDHDSPWERWDEDKACNGYYGDYKIDYDSKETITNWITSMDLVWAEDYEIGLFGTLYFVGFFVGSAFFLQIADVKGRRIVTIVGIIGCIASALLIYANNNQVLTYLCVLVLGVFTTLRILVGYIFALELVPMSRKKLWNLISQCTDAIIVISIGGYFYVIQYGESTIIIYTLISILWLIFIYKSPESPQYLYTTKRWEKCHSSFSKISHINRIEWQGFKFDREDQRNVEEFNIKQSCGSVLKDNKTLKNLFIMLINWSTCSFSYYLLSYYVRYFKGSIYSNTALLGLADILATFGIRGLQAFFQTKIGFMIWFSLVFWVSIFYYTVSHITALVAIWVFMMRFGITGGFILAYYGNSEYFQTDFSSTALGIWNTCARFATIISPMVAEVLPQPIILISVFSFVSLILSFFLIKPKNILISQLEKAEEKDQMFENEVPDLVRDFYGEHNEELEEDKNNMDRKNTDLGQDVQYKEEDFMEDELEQKKYQKEKLMILEGEDIDGIDDSDQI